MTYTPAIRVEGRTYRHYTIGTFSNECPTYYQAANALPASQAWPLANLALYIPMYIDETLTVYEAGFGTGATVGGNFDVGIYNAAGTRLVSSGTTARTASAWNVAALTDTTLTPGWYYAAMAADTTANYSGSVALTAGLMESLGVCEQQTAFVLPTTATLTRTTRTLLPVIAFSVRSIAL